MIIKNYNIIINSDGSTNQTEVTFTIPSYNYFISRKDIVNHLSNKYNKDFSLRISLVEDNIPLSMIYHTLEKLSALDMIQDAVLESTDPIDNTLYLSVPNANLRAVLINHNLFNTVNNAVLNSNNATLIQYWDYANYIDYTNPNVAALATALSLDTATLETLFVEAVLL